MKTVHFPAEPMRSAAIERILPKADLSKTKAIANQHFASDHQIVEKTMARFDELNKQEIQLNQNLCQIQQDLWDLTLNKDFLTPDQIKEKLTELFQKIFSCPVPNTEHLKNQLSHLKQDWNHLCFSYHFPQVDELNPDSFQGNAFFQITQRIKEIRKSNPREAERLENVLHSLVDQYKAAEAVFFGKGVTSAYQRLPKEVHLAVQQHLFSLYPKETMDQILQKDGGSAMVAGAIMDALIDRLMTIELSPPSLN